MSAGQRLCPGDGQASEKERVLCKVTGCQTQLVLAPDLLLVNQGLYPLSPSTWSVGGWWGCGGYRDLDW